MIGNTIGGKYAIVRQLGAGGMGAVYEARHTGTGRRVAVKVITGELSGDPKLLARFELEARAAGAIESEHIAQVLDVGQDGPGGAPFLAMEYLEGEDVQQLLTRLGPIPADLAMRIGVQACLGLEKAHAQGIVHRDIKPANLFLTVRDGGELRVKVLDFGIAKVSPGGLGEAPGKAPLTRMGMLLGSPLYMSPEQARGNAALDHRTDIWSLGIVLYQALTGRTPLQDVTSVGDFIMSVCTLPVTQLRTYAAWIDPAVAVAVERALVLDPAQRYQSATEMREALSAFLPQGASIRAAMLVSAGAAGAATVAPATVAATPVRPTATAEMSVAGATTVAVVSQTSQPLALQATLPGVPMGAAPPATGAAPAPQPAPKGRTGLVVAAVLAAAALGGLGVALALGAFGGRSRTHGVTVGSADPAGHPAAPMVPASMLGTWWGDGGQIYDATRGVDGVFFKLRDPEHLAAQGYVAGDPHFVLHAIEGESSVFRVEARARPLPPRGLSYDPARAHATCVTPWHDVGGKPLRAELSSTDKLTVKLVRLDAPGAMFTREGAHVIGCSGLAEAHATEADVVLSREPVGVPAAPKWTLIDAGAHDAAAHEDAGAHDDTPAVVGAPCQSDAQCRTRNCAAGVCEPRARRGGPCTADDGCFTHRCVAGTCR